MKKSFIIFNFIFIATLLQSAYCQESFGGVPHSETHYSLAQDVPVWELPAITPAVTSSGTTNLSYNKGQALCIGYMEPVKLSMANAGRTDHTANGDKIWRLGFHSDGAHAMSLSFSNFNIPENAELYVYNADRSFTIGKFTSKNIMEGNIFFTQEVAGDEIYVEYFEPHDAAFAGTIEIDNVGICDKNIFEQMKGAIGNAEGDCHIDVTCPEANNWQDQVNSIVCIRYTESGKIYMCSGAMINNTKQDRKKYVLSAAHCHSDIATNHIFYFNYQALQCGVNYGNYKHTATGAVMRAMGTIERSSDFLLLEITGELGASFRDKVYFAGWDRSTGIPSTGICIHHPGGDWKKVSIPQSVVHNPFTPRFWETSWKPEENNQGVTENGSSGSPLFNAAKRIVGSLSYGASSCQPIDNGRQGTTGKDYYGKLSWAWTNNNNPNAAAKLQPWLAPNNTSAMSLDGIYYADATSIKNSTSTTHSLKISPNPTTDGNITIQGTFESNRGHLRIVNMLGELVYSRDINTENEINISVPGIHNGLYILEITEANKTHRSKLLINK